MLILISIAMFAQVGINADNSAPDPSAMIDAKSTTKGLLPPRMTRTQRNAIVSTAQGLMIYNTTDNKPNYWNGTVWMNYDNTISEAIGVPRSGMFSTHTLSPSAVVFSISTSRTSTPTIRGLSGLFNNGSLCK
jgi:hypothetical protein